MENMGNNSLRKPIMRRKSHARRPPQDCVVDMAEARREIAKALHHHRSSSSSSSSSSATASCFMNREPTLSSGNSNINPIFGGSQYCYSIMESIPLPEPIWSTTAPSILAAAPAPPAMEAPEFEWGESQAAYTWWLGFLQTLDCKYNEEPKYPFGNSRIMFGQCCQEGPKLGEPPFVDHAYDQTSPDEWLMFPTNEDQGESVIRP